MALGTLYPGFAPETPDAYFDLHNNNFYMPLSLFTSEMRDLVNYRPDAVMWRDIETDHGRVTILDIDDLFARYDYWEDTLGRGRWQNAMYGYLRFVSVLPSTEHSLLYYTWMEDHFARVESFGGFCDFELRLVLDIEMRKLCYKFGPLPSFNDAMYTKRWQQLVAQRDHGTPLPAIDQGLLTAEQFQTGPQEAFRSLSLS
ncbi:hypothetical protein Hypma_002273 [Hypsizygus marmoreus]|uniref:Uncharacterized protein n=1 Tax=Hypsizygus marmoreus TaxID=39966 RepID=A0A369K7S7_HYPMA|nr:hypothetical protein Hypma_002273 [Hypsizygus marmoreus]